MKVSALRILQIVEATGGGVGRHVLDLCERLLHSGHEVHLAYSDERMEDGFARRMRSMDGLQRFPVSMRRSPHPSDLFAVARIGRYLRGGERFSIVHGHSSKGGAMARISAALCGLPAVYTPNAFRTQDPEISTNGFRVYREVELALAALGGEIIAVSGDERRHAEGLGLPPSRLHVVHNGVPLQRRAEEQISRAELGLSDNALVIGAVGRLTHQKAPERLLLAFEQLQHPNLQLVIVGDGPQEEQLRAQCQSLGIADRVHWLGARDGFSMMPLFDLLALPSRYEGLPYVLLEALLSGLPIVVSDVGGAREAVVDGENGWVVNEGDMPQLISSLQRLIDDKEGRARMSLAARHRAEQFSLSRMVERTLAVYERALERRG